MLPELPVASPPAEIVLDCAKQGDQKTRMQAGRTSFLKISALVCTRNFNLINLELIKESRSCSRKV